MSRVSRPRAEYIGRGRATAALVLALAAGLVASSAQGAFAAPVLHGPGFTTTRPSGWQTRVRYTPVMGTKAINTDFSLSSGKTALNRWGIPAAGQFGITVDALPVAGLARNVPGAGRLSPGGLLNDIVDVPGSAQLVLVQAHRHATTLGGASAATISYVYYYAGRVSYQHDIVARHRGTVYFVELDTDFNRKGAGNAALATVVKGWHWG